MKLDLFTSVKRPQYITISFYDSPTVNGEWTSETEVLNVNHESHLRYLQFWSSICHKQSDIYARKWLNVTAVTPIYVELITFGDKHVANVITRLRKTDQTGHVLETEIVAGIFPPVAEDNTEYSIEPHSVRKIFVTLINTFPNPPVFSMVEFWILQKMNE